MHKLSLNDTGRSKVPVSAMDIEKARVDEVAGLGRQVLVSPLKMLLHCVDCFRDVVVLGLEKSEFVGAFEKLEG